MGRICPAVFWSRLQEASRSNSQTTSTSWLAADSAATLLSAPSECPTYSHCRSGRARSPYRGSLVSFFLITILSHYHYTIMVQFNAVIIAYDPFCHHLWGQPKNYHLGQQLILNYLWFDQNGKCTLQSLTTRSSKKNTAAYTCWYVYTCTLWVCVLTLSVHLHKK